MKMKMMGTDSSQKELQLHHPGPARGVLRTNVAKLGPSSATLTGGALSFSRERERVRGECGLEGRRRHIRDHDAADSMATEGDDDDQQL